MSPEVFFWGQVIGTLTLAYLLHLYRFQWWLALKIAYLGAATLGVIAAIRFIVS